MRTFKGLVKFYTVFCLHVIDYNKGSDARSRCLCASLTSINGLKKKKLSQMCQTRSCTKMKKSYFFLFFFFLTAAFFKLLTAGREKSLMPRLSAVTFVKQQACVSVYIRKDALNHQHHFQTPARGGFFWTKHP